MTFSNPAGAAAAVIEVIQHLADSDVVFSYRLKMMLTEDRPPLLGYDQDRWAGELRYREVPLELALDQLRSMRAANLHLAAARSTASFRPSQPRDDAPQARCLNS